VVPLLVSVTPEARAFNLFFPFEIIIPEFSLPGRKVNDTCLPVWRAIPLQEISFDIVRWRIRKS
jgi:hypothetical protein